MAAAAAAGRLRSISLACVLHNNNIDFGSSLHRVESLVAVPSISSSFYPETTDFSHVSPSWH